MFKNSKQNKSGFQRQAYRKARSVFKFFLSEKTKTPLNSNTYKIKVAFIHNEKKIHTGMHTGAAQINNLMAEALFNLGVKVKHFYPIYKLTDTPIHLRGLTNILFFYSLLEQKEKMLKFDIIQGTTYTPMPFLAFKIPTICHFGSTGRGFLESVPATKLLQKGERQIFKELVRYEIIPDFDLKTFRPLEDVADIEIVAAERATACIATSEIVRENLLQAGIADEKITVIHNAIEDYWFTRQRPATIQPPHLVFLGRLGNDVFTLKLKGLDRLVNFYRAFPDVPKTMVCMTTNRKLKDWLKVSFPKHYMFVNLRKDLIPGALSSLYGSILFLSSRYEGFSLSLIEGMSQGLVPVSFPVGIAPEIIKNGVNGFLVETEQEAEACAREILKNDKKRLKMAENARKTAEEFKSLKIAGELLALYRKIKIENSLHKNN